MLNTRGGRIQYGILFMFSLLHEYSNLEYVHVPMSHTGLTRRLTVFVFLRLHPRNTWIPIQHLGTPAACALAFTRYLFTSRLLCTNQPSFHSPCPPALPTLVQYYCTTIGQYTTPRPTSRLCAIHHTRLVITISCKCQRARVPKSGASYLYIYV